MNEPDVALYDGLPHVQQRAVARKEGSDRGDRAQVDRRRRGHGRDAAAAEIESSEIRFVEKEDVLSVGKPLRPTPAIEDGLKLARLQRIRDDRRRIRGGAEELL